jgi:hypothetical protein
MKKRNLFLALAVLLGTSVQAQDITKDRILWKVDSLVDLLTKDRFAYSCSFETRGTDEIVWSQSEGFTSVIRVNIPSRTWQNVRANGSMSYAAKYEEESGKIIFERSYSGYRIKFILGPETNPSLHHEYKVSSVTKIP